MRTRDFVIILPYEECIDDILQTNEEYSDQDALLMTNVEHEAINNVTDAVLCASFFEYNNGILSDRVLEKDTCFVRSEGDIASIRQKQAGGDELSESDKDTLREHYFEHCSAKHEARYRQNTIKIHVQLVSAPHQCQSSGFDKFNALKDSEQKGSTAFAVVAFVITAVGILGAGLSLSVFCRPSFLSRHHVGYLCIERSIFDILMLVYCVQTGFGLGKILHRRDADDSMIINSRIITEIQCIASFVLFMPSEIGTMLLTLAISVQRLMAVAAPLKAKVYLNKSVAKKICIAVLCICVVISAICAVLVLAANNFKPTCMITDIDMDLMFYFSIAWSIIIIAVPWLIIIIVTISTLYHIVASRRKRNELTSENPNAAQDELVKEDIVMVILICVGFLIALAPEILLNVASLVGRKSNRVNIFFSTIYIELWMYFALSIKSSLNFFIYFASNPKFREIITSYVK